MIGSTVGHYRITAKLGAGGMGEVFLAKDARLDRRAAVKFLPAELAGDPDRRQRFLIEARAASALGQPPRRAGAHAGGGIPRACQGGGSICGGRAAASRQQVHRRLNLGDGDGQCAIIVQSVQPSTSERFRLVTAIFLTLNTGGTTGVTLLTASGGAATLFTAGRTERLGGDGNSALWMATGFGVVLG